MQQDNQPTQYDELPEVQQPTAMPFTVDSNMTNNHKKSNKKKVVLLLFAGIGLVAIGLGIGWYIFKDEQAGLSSQQVTEVVETIEEVTKDEVDAELAKFITPTTGETWLDQPKQLNDQKYYRSFEGIDTLVTYYEVGKRGDNVIIMSVVSELGDDIRLYEKTPTGKVSIIVQPDPDFQYNPEETYLQEMLAEGIGIDTTTRYDSLTIPKAIKLDSGYYVAKADYPSLGDFIRPGDSNSKVTIVKEFGGSTLTLHEQTNQETNLTSISYRMVSPINTRIMLDYTPLEKKLQNYSWTTGVSNIQDELVAISYGCGGLYTSVTKVEQAKDEDFIVVGTAPSGKQVYHAKDPNNTIVTKAYDEFIQFYAYEPQSANATMTKEEFINQHGVIFFKDTTGHWFVYARGQLRPGGGCAKPVVYMYPQKTTEFTLRVGADVKISIPAYDPKTGWRGEAHPDGTLYVSGNTYESLFWEGPGYGEYPAIQAGTIVPTSMAVGVIRDQLHQLGLNGKETDDFIAYWQDKMPNKPFTRLTWLTTADMNNVAPLVITPKPDTLLRVFLDYSGLDTPIAIPRQDLQLTERKGFTVVEWGGLSPFKLY